MRETSKINIGISDLFFNYEPAVGAADDEIAGVARDFISSLELAGCPIDFDEYDLVADFQART